MKRHIKGMVLIGLLALLMVVAVLPVVVLAEGESGGALELPIDLTPVVQSLITVLAAVVTLKVVPWIKAIVCRTA